MNRKLITLGRIIHTGTVNFIRNASLAIAAMAVMVVTLTIILFSLVTNETFKHTIDQITNKIDISVYLKDEVTDAQAKDLVSQLDQLENVKSTQYLSKEQVLKRYTTQNAGNADLLSAINSTSNPLPATILVKPRDLNKIQDIKDFLSKSDIKNLQSDEPSYSGDRKEAIDKITHATNVLQRIGIVAVIKHQLHPRSVHCREHHLRNLVGDYLCSHHQFGLYRLQLSAAGKQSRTPRYPVCERLFQFTLLMVFDTPTRYWYYYRSRLISHSDPAVPQIQNFEITHTSFDKTTKLLLKRG
jgi:hypothetical protein